jgi:ABC-type uncharacterized transport system permease subunit
MMSVIFFHLVVVAYAVAAAFFFFDLARPSQKGVGSSRVASRTLTVSVALHSVYLALELRDGSVTGWSLKFALSLCGVSVSLAYLVLRRRTKIDAIGVAVAPLSLTLLVGAEFLRASGPVTDFPRTLLLMHVAANVLGVGLFLLAGASSAFYLVQEGRLKAKRVSPNGGRLPPLDALDLTEHRLLLAGFPLLTFGIVSGAVFASSPGAMTSAGIARSALAYATWLLVAGVLVLRAVAGWRGRRAAYGTLAGVVCVLLIIAIYVAHSSGGAAL